MYTCIYNIYIIYIYIYIYVYMYICMYVYMHIFIIYVYVYILNIYMCMEFVDKYVNVDNSCDRHLLETGVTWDKAFSLIFELTGDDYVKEGGTRNYSWLSCHITVG